MDKSYQHAEDFLLDVSFQSFVLGQDPVDVAYWEEWIKQNPEKQSQVRQAMLMLKALRVPEEDLADAEFQKELAKFQKYIQQHPSRESELKVVQFSPKRPFPLLRYAAVLAGILILAALGFWSLQLYDPQTISYKTGAEEKLRIELPDYSIVHLNSNSTLRVSKHWQGGSQREVWVTGEAFFHVKHGPAIGSAKFSVHAAGARVDVLGTQFNVYDRQDLTRVVLNSGNITLKLAEKDDTMVMRPGEMVEFAKDQSTVTRKQVKPELYTSWKESQIVFDNTPMKEIAILIENNYGVDVVIADSTILERRMTFKLQENDLDLLLGAISKTFSFQIVRSDDKVLISKEVLEVPKHQTNKP